jgi:hypothetical protein
MRTALVVATFVAFTGTAHAGIVESCPTADYIEHPAYVSGPELAARVAASDIPDYAKATLADQWRALEATNSRLRARKFEYDISCSASKIRADDLRTRNMGFEIRCSGEEPPDDCYAERDALLAEYAKLEREAAALDRQTEVFTTEAHAFVAALGAFHTDGEAALVRWFTGKKVLRMTAKTWIDGGAIEELTLKTVKLVMNGDDIPQGPDPAGDFRLYQTFVAEVHFKQGKIKKAFFVKHSPQHRAGRTKVPAPGFQGGGPRIIFIGIPATIRVVDQKVSISADRTRVVFTRKVEGHPALSVLAMDEVLDTLITPLKLIPIDKSIFGGMGHLPVIWNSLRLEVTAEEALPSSDGSDFPSHRFWMGQHELPHKDQVQPSQYFRED